jgi:hypothetical protein
MEDPSRTFSEYIEEIKESLTDAQYKQGMELCQTLFKQEKPDEKLYKMTYLSPLVFSDTHDCGDEDCVHGRSLNISFVKKTALVKMKPERVNEILEENCFMGDDLGEFIETNVLSNHQEFEMDLPEFEWDTFPVLKMEEV